MTNKIDNERLATDIDYWNLVAPEVKSEVLPKVEQPQFTIPKPKLTVDDIKDHIFEYAKQENIPAHKVVEVLDILIGLEN